jgi:hypothetical protein
LTDNDRDAETWQPLKPVEHRRRTIWSVSCTVVLLAVLTFSLAALV